MRVIGGEFRSRILRSLEGTTVRPTPDRLRETLFNVIAPEVPDSVFLDVYAGTGAVGIEALSRGAKRAIFIERSRQAAAVIQANLASLHLTARARLVLGSAKLYLAAQEADIAFVDPPYDAPTAYDDSLKILGMGGVPFVIAQHDRRTTLEERFGSIERTREIRQGDNVLSFYRRIEE